MRCIKTKTAAEFIGQLDPNSEIAQPGSGEMVLFRGEAGDYPLMASGFRSSGEWCELVRRQVEEFRRFCEIADREGLRIPGESPAFRLVDFCKRRLLSERITGWPDIDVVPALSIAQHYGLRTCLLDFTRNPFVAAYFAAKHSVAKEPRRDLYVWVIRFPSDGFLSVEKLVWGAIVRMAEAPMADNENMRAQEGCFLVQRLDGEGWSPPKSLNEVLSYAEPVDGLPIVTRVSLSASEAPEVLQRLARYGFRAARLFPGYAGVTKEVAEEASVTEKLSLNRRL